MYRHIRIDTHVTHTYQYVLRIDCHKPNQIILLRHQHTNTMTDMLEMEHLLTMPDTACVSESETGSDAVSDGEWDEEAPPALCREKSFSQTAKAPRKALPVKKKTPVKKTAVKKTPVKKTRTMRRPYKSMPQEKLVSKQEIVKSRFDLAQSRFDLAKKRFEGLQTQLERLNSEIEVREVVGDFVGSSSLREVVFEGV